MKINSKNVRLPELMMQEEKEKMEELIKNTHNPMERAMLLIMWETGLSPEEWLALKKRQRVDEKIL
jgi:hypothetical protein